MFVRRVASLSAALSLDLYGVSGGFNGAARVHMLLNLILFKSADDLRTPKRHKDISFQGHAHYTSPIN